MWRKWRHSRHKANHPFVEFPTYINPRTPSAARIAQLTERHIGLVVTVIDTRFEDRVRESKTLSRSPVRLRLWAPSKCFFILIKLSTIFLLWKDDGDTVCEDTYRKPQAKVTIRVIRECPIFHTCGWRHRLGVRLPPLALSDYFFMVKSLSTCQSMKIGMTHGRENTQTAAGYCLID